MFEEIEDYLIQTQIRDAFLQFLDGRITEEYCKSNIQFLIDFGKKQKKIKKKYLLKLI